MKIKSIKEQLIDMGFKTGDRINIKGYMYNPYIIHFKTEELEDMDGHCDSLEELIGCEFEKYTPTKEELLEELKKRSKKFEDDEECFYIYWHRGKVGYVYRGNSKYIYELYFDEETAKQICEELNADKEKTRILFD